MGCDEERAESIETLRELLDRLCSPDLTLGEAKYLRNEILGLLNRIEREPEPGKTASAQSTFVPHRSVQ